MLTPQEVSGRAFSKAAFGGYNMAMVDEFLDELTDDYTSLYKRKRRPQGQAQGAGRQGGGVPRDGGFHARRPPDRPAHGQHHGRRGRGEEKKAVLAGAEDEARAKIGALQSDVELEQRRLNAAKAATAEFLQKTRELAQAQLALIERAPDLTPEEIAGGEKDRAEDRGRRERHRGKYPRVLPPRGGGGRARKRRRRPLRQRSRARRRLRSPRQRSSSRTTARLWKRPAMPSVWMTSSSAATITEKSNSKRAVLAGSTEVPVSDRPFIFFLAAAR